MTQATIARIFVGTAGLDIDEHQNDIEQAWHFLDTELRKHEDEVAIAIEDDDNRVFGEIWSFSTFPQSPGHLQDYLDLIGLYDD
ncbi:hypothetical protein [Burkholderia alba]|uniref:hypothetical protein n=1 Tax=Burkholderia alba TaxID=2683677 RepID=UPI002B052781|nr:hypothetical protein [Burkholderia alba]